MVLCRAFLYIVLFTLVYVENVTVPSLENEMTRPLVHTNVGPIQGLWAEDGNYSMFMGIPYAEVDRNKPFGDAVPNPKFENVFEAFDDSSKCPQIFLSNNSSFSKGRAPSLDCLNLNIYVPRSASASNKLPILFWIFGGRFARSYAGRLLNGPKYLVRHDIILVTINYRLGPYGFMCLDIPEVPGNQGLRDQLLAMKWIKENIAAFGGDDTRITISGSSSGATSADLHLYYRQEELFNRIILQGGVALKQNAIVEPDRAAPLKLAAYFGHYTSDHLDALSFLASLHSDQVITATVALGLSFRPCVEKSFPNVTRYIREHPVNKDILQVTDINILIGFSNDESYVKFAMMDNQTIENTDFVSVSINSHFDFADDYEHFYEMKRIVSQFYLGHEDVPLRKQRTIDMDSDFYAYHPILRSVKKYLDNGVDSLFFYLFSYCGGRNFHKSGTNVTGGAAAHADELGYLFSVFFLEDVLQPDDELILDRITKMWANFVKHGNPTPSLTDLIPVQWPAVTRDKLFYLELDKTLRVGASPFHDRMAFHDLFHKMNHQYLRGYARKKEAADVTFCICMPFLFVMLIYRLVYN